MPILFRDYETRSTLDLTKVGAWKYAAHPMTDVWCCAYAVDHGPVKLWIPGDPVPPEFIEAASNPDYLVVAHNDAFERAIEQHIMSSRYGFPLVPIERHRCTQAAALALALPAKLELVAEALGLEHRKDMTGHRLMRRMARPRKPRPGEPDGVYWLDDAERLEKLYTYCWQDVEVERELYHRLRPLIPDEQQRWQFDATVNERGFALDRKLATAMAEIGSAAKARINAELEQITGGAMKSITQNDRLAAWLEANGCPVDDVTKGTLSHALRRKNLAPEVVRVLELRRAGAHAAAAKPLALLDRCDEDGRVRGAFTYHGASTGRWTSLGAQVQNLKRPDGLEDPAGALELVMTGDIERVREKYPEPLAVIGSVVRGLICAGPGMRFIAADFSGIESRNAAWLAGETWKIEQWRKFDETGDPNDEPYLILGRRFGVPENKARLIGKITDLAFGFMGAIGAWRAACKLYGIDDDRTDREVRALQQAWHRTHPKIKQFWGQLDRAAIAATRTPGRIFHAGTKVSFRREGEFLFMQLPSGRELSYAFAELMTTDYGDPAVTFKDVQHGKFGPCRGGRGSYGGVWMENAVSATARDLFACAMPRLETAGYPVVFHVHDEIVAEVPVASEHTAEQFVKIITEVPAWGDGLAITAKGRSGTRFLKADAPKEAKPESPPRSDDASKTAGKADVPPWEDIVDAPEPNTSPEDERVEPIQPKPKIEPVITSLASASGAATDEDGEPDEGTSKAKPNGNGHDPAGFRAEDDPRPRGSYEHGEEERGHKVGEFIYQLANGEPYLRVVKMKAGTKKSFPQYHRENDQWVKGAPSPRVPYRLPELAAATAHEPVWIPEGEKDCETLAALGLISTCNPEGGLKFGSDLVSHFAGKKLAYVLEDNDDIGRKHAAQVAEVLQGTVTEIRIISFPDVPEGEDVSYWLNELGHTKTELLERAKNAKAARATSSIRLHWYDDDDEPDQPWLIHGLMPETGCGLISGQWGAYKSSAALDLSAAVITGSDFLGHSIMRRGGVLYLAAEGGSGVKKRFRAILEDKYPGIGRVPFVFAKSCPRLLDKSTIEVLAPIVAGVANRMMAEFGVPLVLIIIDTIAASAGYTKPGDENDAAIGAMIMNLFTELSRRSGALVLGVDHFGKAVETGTRGTSAKESAADVVLALLGSKEITGAMANTKLAVRKVRDGETGREIAFTARIADLGLDAHGKPRTAPVIDWKLEDAEFASKARAEGWPKPLHLLRRALMATLANGEARDMNPKPGGASVRAIDIEVVREEFDAIYPAEGDEKKKKDTRRMAWRRMILSAQEKELIGVREVGGTTLVWLEARDV